MEGQVLPPRQRRRIIEDATQGLGSSRPAHLSIRGGRFRLVNAEGQEYPLDTHHIDIIVVDASDKTSRVYYEGAYDPAADAPPACFSDNGTGPSVQSMVPQAPTCAVCPRNVMNSAQTFTGKPTTACGKRKKLAFIVPDDPALNIYELQIPPGSLSNLGSYGEWLGKQRNDRLGRALDIADVVTQVSFDPDKQFVMMFKATSYADDDRTLALLDQIDNERLSDVYVGRLDVAHDPDTIKQMLMSSGNYARAAVTGPAPTQATPQRAAPTALPAPAAQQPLPPPQQAAPSPAQEPAPTARGRGRTPRAVSPAPAAAGNTAPFIAPAAPRATAPMAPADNLAIPEFLKRAEPAAQGTPPAPPPPRFGVGAAPPPPAGVTDALAAAMSLPTRR